nr:TPA_asm: hypothetical protein [Clonorhabdovirus 2]
MSEEQINQKITQLESMNLRDPTPVPAEFLRLDADGEPVIDLPPPPVSTPQTPNPGVYFATHLGAAINPQDQCSAASSSDISASAYCFGPSLVPVTHCGMIQHPPQDKRQLLGMLRTELDKCLPNPMPGKAEFLEQFTSAWFNDDVVTMAASIRDIVYRVHTSDARRGRSSSRPPKPSFAVFEEYIQRCNEGSSVTLTRPWASSIYEVCPAGLISKLMTIPPSQRLVKMFRRKPRTKQDIFLIVSSYVNGET